MSADLRKAAALMKIAPWRQAVDSLVVRARNVQAVCDHVRDEDQSAKGRLDSLLKAAETSIARTEMSTQLLLKGRVVWVLPDAQLTSSPTASGLRDVLASVQPFDVVVLRPGFYRGPFRCAVPNITIRGEGDVILLNTDPLPCVALGLESQLIDLKIKQRSREGCAVMIDGGATVHLKNCSIHATNCCGVELERGSLNLESCEVSSDLCSGVAVGRASAVGGCVVVNGGSIHHCGQHGFHIIKGQLDICDAVVSENAGCGIMLEDAPKGGIGHSLRGSSIHANGDCGLFVGRNQVIDTLSGCHITGGKAPYFVDPKAIAPLDQLISL